MEPVARERTFHAHFVDILVFLVVFLVGEDFPGVAHLYLLTNSLIPKESYGKIHSA